MNSNTESLKSYIQKAMKPDEELYAIVDAARNSSLILIPRDQNKIETYTLFGGEMASFLDHVAPHLVPLDLDSEFFSLWCEHLGQSVGILFLSLASTPELRNHLRKIFIVNDEEGNEFSFRYYDPRVLRTYLPTCTGEEARDFFGPIRLVLVESEVPRQMLSCQRAPTGVKIEKFVLK